MNLKMDYKLEDTFYITKKLSYIIFSLAFLVFIGFFMKSTILLIIFMIISSIIILISPIYIGVPLYWIFCFSTQYYTISTFSAARILGIALIIGMFIRAIRNKSSFKFNGFTISLVLISIYSLISITYSKDLDGAFSEFMVLMINIVIIILLYVNKVNFKKLFHLFYIASIISLFFASILILFNGNLIEGILGGDLSRISMDDSQNPGEFGRNTLIIFVILLFYFEEKNNKSIYFFSILSIIISIILIVISGSRTSLFGMILSFILYFLLQIFCIKKSKKNTITILFILISSFILLNLFDNSLKSIISRYTLSSIIETQGTRRFVIWDLYLSYVIPNQPIFGVGIGGSSEIAALSYYTNINYIYLKPAHNMYLQILIELGIFGTLIYAMFFITIIKDYFTRTIYEKRMKCGLFIVFLILLVMALGEPMFFSKPFWVIIMLLYLPIGNMEIN